MRIITEGRWKEGDYKGRKRSGDELVKTAAQVGLEAV